MHYNQFNISSLRYNLHMEKFLKQIGACRKSIISDRKKFWETNKLNFESNVKKIVKAVGIPKDWKAYIIASKLLSNRKIMPFDHDSWSNVNLVSATKRQGFEVLMFLNTDGLSFLSLPGLVSYMVHEMEHVKQASRDPVKYTKHAIDDAIAKQMEEEAERVAFSLPDEFRRQYVLENILYCYDLDGWPAAKKMADHMHKYVAGMYSGGYNNDMTDREHGLFLAAKKKGDIDLFIERFQ